jgi:hypothetical protein
MMTVFSAFMCTRQAGRLVVKSSPSTVCFTGGHAFVFTMCLLILLTIGLMWPALYTYKLRITSVEELCEPRFRHRWGAHFVLMRSGWRMYTYLVSYMSMFSVSAAFIFFEGQPILRLSTAGVVILGHVVLLLFFRPHKERRDDFMMVSFELSMLLLVSIGAGAELGSLRGNALKALSIITLVLLAICVMANLLDLLWHLFLKRFTKRGALSAPVSLETMDGEEWVRVNTTMQSDPETDAAPGSGGIGTYAGEQPSSDDTTEV